MKKLLAIALAAGMMLSATACSSQQNSGEGKDRETIYQVALLQSLTQGYYDGIIKVSELKEHGDIGIGTCEGVNGEMIVLDGTVYQALGDKEKLSAVVEENGKNLFYFVKMSGTFEKMNVRSELKQEKPYKTLDKALETDQTEFSYDNISGTVVALYCPDYMNGLNTPGWHFHFISDDKTKGGHLLDLKFAKATAEYDATPEFEMCLTDNGDFQKMELSKDVSDAIKKVETNED